MAICRTIGTFQHSSMNRKSVMQYARRLISSRSFLTTTTEGTLGTLDFQMLFHRMEKVDSVTSSQTGSDIRTSAKSTIISPWHHIPLFSKGSVLATSTYGSFGSVKLMRDINSQVASINPSVFQHDDVIANEALNAHCSIKNYESDPSRIKSLMLSSLLDESSSFAVNMVVEVPKFTIEKMEIRTSLPGNPIKQDVKDMKPRLLSGPLHWNYGALPQTWENPSFRGKGKMCLGPGDNDPVDIVEIGTSKLLLGDIVNVRVIGALAMIDEGKLDWKFIGLQEKDPHFNTARTLKDVDEYFPGVLAGIREWFRWYKTPSNGQMNSFGLNESYIDCKESLEVLVDAHCQWRELVSSRGINEMFRGLWIPKWGTA